MAGGGGVGGGFQFHYSTVDTDKIGLCSRTPRGVHGGWGSRREGLRGLLHDYVFLHQ